MTENQPTEIEDVEDGLIKSGRSDAEGVETEDVEGRVLMKELVTVAILALSLVFASVVAAPTAQASVVVAPTAQASCNTTSWTWPFCHIGRPSIPRFNVNGPRPPLTPKDSVWCTANFITVGNGVGWYRINSTKHDIRFWPDYHHHEFVGIVWNGRAWAQTRQPVYDSVDCDA